MGFKNRILYSKPEGVDIDNLEAIKNPSRLLWYAKEHNITTVPLDLEALCKQLSIPIVYQTLAEVHGIKVAGILSSRAEGIDWTMYIQKKLDRRRQRFLIAHLLGHYFLYRDYHSIFLCDEAYYLCRRVTEKQQECWKATEFAAALLMPREELVKQIETVGNDPVELAEKFEVNTLAIRFQLERTGLWDKDYMLVENKSADNSEKG